MKRRATFAMAMLALCAVPATAQMWDADAGVASAEDMYNSSKNYILRAAQQFPEDLYSYRPTEEVRTFGQIIGHVANSYMGFCTAAGGTPPAQRENYEERTTKAGLIEALQAAIEYCDQVYGMAYESPDAMVNVFGQQRPRVYALVFNAAHAYEHYGNLVTYMRANGMVPPSSQRGGM
jgi:uncharacterized damage-inducible protein DinB